MVSMPEHPKQINTSLKRVRLYMSIVQMKKLYLVSGNCIDSFMYQQDLQSMNNQSSCYKDLNYLSCRDLFQKKSMRIFYKTETFFTGLPISKNLFYQYSKQLLQSQTQKN